MELFRALATLAEPPAHQTARLASLLGLAAAPTAAAYTDVFVLQQPPYASAYLGADGTIGGEPRDRIAGFWRAVGIEPPREPDHLATMLGAYAALVDCAAAEADGRRREAIRRARHAFLWEHLLSWVPVYLHALARHHTGPYARWGALLLEALLAEARALGPAAAAPAHLREVSPIPDPRGGDVHAFLAVLLAPARSGLVLTRADLARAARTLDLGLRAGDRAVTLRGLLEQDAPATLRWLADEARTWLALHEALATTIAPVAGAWSARASAAAALLDALWSEAVEEQSA